MQAEDLTRIQYWKVRGFSWLQSEIWNSADQSSELVTCESHLDNNRTARAATKKNVKKGRDYSTLSEMILHLVKMMKRSSNCAIIVFLERTSLYTAWWKLCTIRWKLCIIWWELCTTPVKNVYHLVRMVYHLVRNVYHLVTIVYHPVKIVYLVTIVYHLVKIVSWVSPGENRMLAEVAV